MGVQKSVFHPGHALRRKPVSVVTWFGNSGPKSRFSAFASGTRAIADVFGGDVIRAERLMHGKNSNVHYNGEGIFSGIKNPTHRPGIFGVSAP